MSQTCCAVDLYLPQACKNGLIQHLEHLLFYGVDKDSRTASGNTPLHISALSNQVSYVSWSECCNIFGWWCLYQTCFPGIILPLKFLLDVGLFFGDDHWTRFKPCFLFRSFDCCCLCLNEWKPWNRFSNNTNSTIRMYSSRTFVWVVTAFGSVWHFSKFAFEIL